MAVEVRRRLSASRRGAELRLSLAAAALDSYRRDSCLKPFPSLFIRDNVKRFDLLTDTFKQIPPVPILLERLEDISYVDSNREVVDLLKYMFVEVTEPNLVPVPSDRIDAILEKAPSSVELSKPQYVFEVVNGENSRAEAKWRSLAENRNTFFAYHGSKLENFHSIIHYGLQQHMNKNSLYGNGTYLSSELSVSLVYSPIGLNWECSCLGRYLSCVALCELIEDAEGISCHKSNAKRNASQSSLGGEVPHKYYVVSNNDVIRVRYLLVYASDLPLNKNLTPINSIQKGLVWRWISRYKTLTIILIYVFMLMMISLRNNHTFYYFYKKYLEKIQLI